MSFLGNIFKKKPGGTFVGNLLRTASSSIPVVGPAFGSGAGRIEVGNTVTNRELAANAYNQGIGPAPVTPFQNIVTTLAPAFAQSPAGQTVIRSTALELLKKYWLVIVIPVLLIIGFNLMKPKRRFSGSRYRY